MYDKKQEKNLLSLSKQLLEGKLEGKPREEIESLSQVLPFHDWRYYVQSDPVIGDFEYDKLFKRLQHLEEEHPNWKSQDSPTQRVAQGLNEEFETVEHLSPMLSLDNSYNRDDLIDFDGRVKGLIDSEEVSYCVEPKLDGAGISIIYEDDRLIRGSTRGNGVMGDDITTNAKAIRSIPLRAEFSKYGIKKIEIRGETVIDKSAFEKMNQAREKENEVLEKEGKKPLELFKHARNTASGGLRLKDPAEIPRRNLEVSLYNIGYCELLDGRIGIEHAVEKHSDTIKMLHDLGFKTPWKEVGVYDNMDEVVQHCNRWEDDRDNYNYEIDGMVVKVDALSTQKEVGATAHHPRWAIAFKFKAKQAQTTLENIEYQVGRTGAITPVAKLKPVNLTGVTISSVSLHNEDFIQEKDIRLNDTVIVERSGDVIPYIVGPVTAMRTGEEQPIQFPRDCPSCATELLRPEGESVWRCENPSCPAQLEERIIHFVSKGAMNIDGLGRDIVKRFMTEGLINDITDIYNLDYDEVLALEGWKERSVNKLRESIEASKESPIWRLMVAVGVRHVGATTAKMLAKQVEHLLDFKNWTLEQLSELEDVGPKVAESIIQFFGHAENETLLLRLEELGVNLKNEKEEGQNQSDVLEGKTFLFTGSLSLFTRDQAKELVEANGGKNLSGVSKKLNYLVAGEKAGSKLKKAEALGTVEVISESDFMNMINN